MEVTKNITVIPARRRVGNTVNKEEKPMLKVAAYCRVSTEVMNKPPVMRLRWSITPILLKRTLNGSLPEYLLTMV